MPEGEYVSFGVRGADGKKLPEYTLKTNIYTEVDLHGPGSYTVEEDGQRYPVMPFSVFFSRHCQETVWITVSLDGQVICSRPLYQTNFTCDGVKVGNEIHELLFTLPKIVEDQEKQNPLGECAGTLRVTVKGARSSGWKEVPVLVPEAPPSLPSQDSKLRHLTKRDVQQAQGHMAGTIVSREGRATQTLVSSGRHRRATNFSCSGNVLEELLLHYRPRISSHICPPAPSTSLQEESDKGENSTSSRQPLGDMSNVSTQPSVAEKSVSKPAMCETLSPGEIKQRESSMLLDDSAVGDVGAGDKSASISSENVKHRDSLGSATLAEENASHESYLIPLDQIKRRESGMISLGEIKRQDSGISLPHQASSGENDLIPVEQIKRRESGMIPLGQIKRRDSGMIPVEQIKRRESGMIPLGQIKRRDSGLIPWSQIKHRESGMDLLDWSKGQDSDAIPVQKIKRRESCLHLLPSAEELESSEGSSFFPKEFIVIDDSDDDDHNDSIICMGDDDCYILDLTNNISMVELDDSMDCDNC